LTVVGLVRQTIGMVKRQTIEFIESQKPITEPVTKFGGQPVWIDEPQWPVSRSTGKPMRFIGQIAIDAAQFKPVAARMAYVFMTDEEEYVDGTWEPEGGENAVVLQPGQGVAVADLKPLAVGPALYRMVKKFLHKRLMPQPCEFSVAFKPGEDPDFAEEEERAGWDEARQESYGSALEGNKVGGTPGFLQNTEFPGPGRWRLLLQLDSAKVPFSINFGDAGISYVFLSEDGREARFLWQCC
jgi:uncharacterized protein YwqG